MTKKWNSAAVAQARIRLEDVDHPDEIVQPNDALELEAGAIIAYPDHIRLDPADFGKAKDHASHGAQDPVLLPPQAELTLTARRDLDQEAGIGHGFVIQSHRTFGDL